jgi:hypothetical protein
MKLLRAAGLELALAEAKGILSLVRGISMDFTGVPANARGFLGFKGLA